MKNSFTIRLIAFWLAMLTAGSAQVSMVGHVALTGGITCAPGTPSGQPVFSLASGTYVGTQTVTISGCLSGRNIFYRTDGGPVTIASPMYSGALTVSASQSITAICATVGGSSGNWSYQTNGQADLPSSICYTIPGATETGNGTPCSSSGGGIGTQPFATVNWTVGSTATITATTKATVASSTQALFEHLYSGSTPPDPTPAKCDSCTSQVQDFILTASKGSSTFENIETDMPQYDATHNANRQNGLQCNQNSGKWEVDAGSNSGGVWTSTGIACGYAAGVPHEIILRVTHSNTDTGCGGHGCAIYTDLWDNGVHHALGGSYCGTQCQGYGPTTFGAWGFQTQPDFQKATGTALSGTLTLTSATVALGMADESAPTTVNYTITASNTATPILIPNIYVTGNNALAAPSPVLAFGKQATSTSSPAIPISISNPSSTLYCAQFGIGCGTGNIAVTSMVISGTNASDFTLTGTCTTVTSGSDCEPTIAFKPTAAANTNETATLTVNDTGATTSSQTMSLTGTSATTTALSATSNPTALSASTNYQVSANVTAAGTDFTGAGTGTDVNLNGHTLTYGNTSSALQVNAFAQTGFNAQITPHNGTISVGAGTNTLGSAGNLSSAVGPTGSFGLSPTLASSFFNLTFNNSIQYANAVSNNNGLIVFHDNQVNDTAVGTCATVGCRSQLQAAAIAMTNVSGVTSGSTQIYNNYINGGPQGGIDAAAPGAVVSYNTINPGNATGNNTNDFGVWAWGSNAQVHHNVIGSPQTSSSNTRGIQISAALTAGLTGVNVYNNVINVIETATNLEYSGCQHGGAYGIQFDDNPGGNNNAYNNVVTAYAKDCSGQGLRFTDVENVTDVSHDNSYTASRLAGAATCTSGTWAEAANGCAYPLSIDGALGATSLRDTFTGDNGDLFISADGAPGTSGGIQIQSPTFNKGSNPGTFWHFLVVQNGPTSASSQVANVHVIDPTFGAGVSFTDDWIFAQGTNTGPVSVYEDWTQTLTVKKASGPVAVGAVVTYTDTLSNHYTCTTNSSGVCSVALTQYRDNNDTGANQFENRNPYSLSIPLSGCTTYTQTAITISATGSPVITLSGC